MSHLPNPDHTASSALQTLATPDYRRVHDQPSHAGGKQVSRVHVMSAVIASCCACRKQADTEGGAAVTRETAVTKSRGKYASCTAD